MKILNLNEDTRADARYAILDTWMLQPYALMIGERDRNGLGVMAMVDGAVEALLNAGWTPPPAS